MEPSFFIITVFIGAFTSFYIIFYLQLPSSKHSRILVQQEAILQEIEDSLPDSVEFENLLSQVLEAVLSQTNPDSEEENTSFENDFDFVMTSTLSEYLTNFICNTSSDIDKSEKDLLAIQHKVAKDLFHWEEVGKRLQSCQDYKQNLSQFLSDEIAKPRIKLAFVHKIQHHVDIGLLELFLLTYPHANDYHCIHINQELSSETPRILKALVDCFNQFSETPRLFLANQATPEFWKVSTSEANSELICLRELLEFKSDWHYVILKGRHSLPLLPRDNLEQHIVGRIHGMSHFSDYIGGAPFKPPIKSAPNAYILPDDHVVYLAEKYESFYDDEWTLNNAIVSWDLVNFIVKDITNSAMKGWLKNSTLLFSNEPIRISASVESPLESSKRFILQRYLAPDYFPKLKRNDFMSVCNGKKNTLWWNDFNGGCPESSDRRWCFLRLTDLEKAYGSGDSLYQQQKDCFFSNRFNLGAHPTTAICHSLNIRQMSHQ